MDSRLIYSSSEALRGKVKWNQTEGEEWIYFGNGDEVKKDVVKNKIQEHFHDKVLLVAFTRKDSFIAYPDTLMEKIAPILGNSNFMIWDSKFKSAMEFNDIGVLRLGTI